MNCGAPIAFVCGNSAMLLSNSNRIEKFRSFLCFIQNIIINIGPFLQGKSRTHARTLIHFIDLRKWERNC